MTPTARRHRVHLAVRAVFWVVVVGFFIKCVWDAYSAAINEVWWAVAAQLTLAALWVVVITAAIYAWRKIR